MPRGACDPRCTASPNPVDPLESAEPGCASGSDPEGPGRLAAQERHVRPCRPYCLAPRDDGGLGRGVGIYGVRGGTSFSRVYDDVESELNPR